MLDLQKSYLEELRALLNGLECRNIDDLLKESPDIFEALGKEMTRKYINLKTYAIRLEKLIDEKS